MLESPAQQRVKGISRWTITRCSINHTQTGHDDAIGPSDGSDNAMSECLGGECQSNNCGCLEVHLEVISVGLVKIDILLSKTNNEGCDDRSEAEYELQGSQIACGQRENAIKMLCEEKTDELKSIIPSSRRP